MHLSIGGTIKDSRIERVYVGKWYKPWTWNKYSDVISVKGFDLVQISVVGGGGGGGCSKNCEEMELNNEKR